MMMHKKGLQLLYRLYNLISSNMCLQSPYGILEYSTLHSSQERGFWRETKQGTTLCCKQVKVIISLDSVRLSQSPKLLKFELTHRKFWGALPARVGLAGWGRAPWTWGTGPWSRSLSTERSCLDEILALKQNQVSTGISSCIETSRYIICHGHFSGGAHRIWMKHGIASQWIMNTLSAGTSMKWGQTLWTGYTSYNGDN